MNVCLTKCLSGWMSPSLQVCLFVCPLETLSAWIYVCTSVCVFVRPSICISVCMACFFHFFCLFVCLSICIPVWMFVCLSVCTPVSLLVCPYISARICWRKIKPVIAKWQSLKKPSTHDGYTELINGRKEEGKKLEQKGGVIKIGQGERGMKGALNELKENWTNEWNDRQTVKNNGRIPGEWYRWMNNWNNEWRLGGINGMRWKRNGTACKRRLNAVKTYRQT